jgi:hypothetical protein
MKCGANQQGVVRAALAEPPRAALEIAHSLLRCSQPLDDMLKVPALAIVLRNVARQHLVRSARVDFKRLQANDLN